MEAYCVKCKTKREMTEPKAEYTATGTAGTRGKCPVCGTTMYRMGVTPEHANVPKPEVVASPKRKAKTAKSKNGKAAKSSGPRVGKLVIVESPTKAKTVGRFLGKGYTVKASVGHVRDLLRSTLSVDVDNDFTPKYRVPNEKKEIVKELTALANRADSIYLATDPDREGEAIAWHLMESAGIDRARTHRVVFHEITPSAIGDAFRASARHRHAAGERAAGPPHSRSAGGLRTQPAVVAQDPRSAERRSGAERGAAVDRRA